LHLEALEDRCLLSGYSITVIGPVSHTAGINNASVVQVVGTNSNGHAFVWDTVHGMQDLGTFHKEVNSEAYGVNDSGQVVGVSFTDSLTSQQRDAFLWTSSQGMQSLGQNDYASGINAAGEVSGTIISYQHRGSEIDQAGLWSGHWTGLAAPTSWGQGINNYGQVVGYTENFYQRAFLWTPSTSGGTTGTIQNLGTFGGSQSYAAAINGHGDVTGNASLPGNNSHAFVWQPSTANGTSGTMTDLDPSSSDSLGVDINSSGLVVGSSDGAPVLWRPGTNGSYTMTSLNNLIPTGTGWVIQSATGINDSGQIVVEATSLSGGRYGLLLTPSPTRAMVRHGADAHPTSTAASLLPGKGLLDAAGTVLTALGLNIAPAGGTVGSAAHADPMVTALGGVQHSSGPSSSAVARRAGTGQAVDQVFADLGDALADPLAVDLAVARLS
jgi:probable HAF family extracellular repeat protein